MPGNGMHNIKLTFLLPQKIMQSRFLPKNQDEKATWAMDKVKLFPYNKDRGFQFSQLMAVWPWKGLQDSSSPLKPSLCCFRLLFLIAILSERVNQKLVHLIKSAIYHSARNLFLNLINK